MVSNSGISQSQYNQVMLCVSELVRKLGLSTVLLVNSAGRILVEKTTHAEANESTTALAVLASASYAAAAEMARQLGETKNFKMMHYEGQNYNIFISSVADDLFLVIIFGTGIALGMVRLLVKKTLIEIIPILSKKQEDHFSEIFDQHFQGLLSDKLDQSFLDE
jgi:predicted regulator of Ras-like GTPase activity (Roadblock/LC7/MglB family)